MTMILKGCIVSAPALGQLETTEHGYLIAENGHITGIYPVLPEQYAGAPVEDYGDDLIVQSFADLHLHAPQYPMLGMGMDLPLLDWLNTYAFPTEARFADTDYARTVYRQLSRELIAHGTTRVCMFSSLHTAATLILMEERERAGVTGYVGKVNMDRNSPDYLREASAEASAKATREWIRAVAERHYDHVQPILTPRFTPSCSDELMELLHDIQKETGLPVQSHLSENPGEIAWVKELCPWSEFYGDAYDRFGLFGADCKTVMAHCVYSGKEERQRMKENGVFIAHCPESNMNLSSGVAPVRTFLEEGMHVGIGSDVAGGSTENLFKAMALAIQASKLRWRMQDDSLKPLTLEEVFYIATKGGGEFFGNVGSFEPGFELDAVVLDDTRIVHSQNLDVRARLERMIYLADEREVRAKYVRGREICLQ